MLGRIYFARWCPKPANFGRRQLAIKSERIPQKVQPAVLVASLEVYIQEDLFH
jgi:hypothetical protein